MMISRSVILACFLAGSSAAFAVQQPPPPAFAVRSNVLQTSNVLRMSGGDAPELSVRNGENTYTINISRVDCRDLMLFSHSTPLRVATSYTLPGSCCCRCEKGTKLIRKYFPTRHCCWVSHCFRCFPRHQRRRGLSRNCCSESRSTKGRFSVPHKSLVGIVGKIYRSLLL